MATIYISIGSNIDPLHYIALAIQDLQAHFTAVRNSRFYESEAVGFEGENFINLVSTAQTDLGIPEVVALLHHIEDEHGRSRTGPRFSSRTIDLDLLLYDDQVYEQNGIVIPRDEILTNAFVLCPLAEIYSQGKHPVVGKTYQQLWDEFDQASQPLWPLTVNQFI
jgi:2-amino-4-hydroxy-6-hydroxymethyldihydropteridine diphosphokinase